MACIDHILKFLNIFFLFSFITKIYRLLTSEIVYESNIKYHIHVINFKEASGRFFFHFLEVFKKCIGYIRIFFIHFLEISKFW